MIQARGGNTVNLIRPFVTVYVGLHAGVLREFAAVTKFYDLMNTAEECLPAWAVYPGILHVWGNVGDNENLGNPDKTKIEIDIQRKISYNNKVD